MADLTDSWTMTQPVPTMPGAGHFLHWREHWSLGISAMDADHRAMVTLLDHLGTEFALDSQAVLPARHLQRRMTQLGEFTRVHFAREELMMRDSDYPELSAHRSEHAMLLAEFTVLTREVTASGASRLDPALLDGLKAWFLGHLLDDDRRLAEYLRSVGYESHH